MSKCGRTAQLESMLSNAPSQAVTSELEAHASHCAPCAHELRWLRTEEALFSQRRTRQQVRSMYPVTPAPKPQRRVWSTVALAMAASLLLALGVGFQRDRSVPSYADGAPQMSQELASLDISDRPLCSTPQPGVAFACDALVLASFR